MTARSDFPLDARVRAGLRTIAILTRKSGDVAHRLANRVMLTRDELQILRGVARAIEKQGEAAVPTQKGADR